MNARERLLLIAAVIMLGGVVFKFLIYDPQQAAYASLVQERDAASQELDRNKRILARANSVRAEYNRLISFIATVEAKLPTRKEIPALLTAMEQFTKRLGITWEGIHPGSFEAVTAAPSGGGGSTTPAAKEAGAKAVPYSKMSVTFQMTGTFAQIVAYLHQLRDFPRLVVVDSIALSPKILPKLSTSFTAEIYTLGTPIAAAPASRPGASPAGSGPAAPSSGAPASPPASGVRPAVPSGVPVSP